jgi:hypothetical protein
MKIATKISIVAIFMLIFWGCENEHPEYNIMDYFWPLQKGKIFTFESKDGLKRRIQIMNITSKNNGKIFVETEQQVEQPANVIRLLKIFYEIDSQQEVIQQESLFQDESNFIILKGPLQRGTTWNTQRIVKHENEIVDTPNGHCEIAQMKRQYILSQKTFCLQTVCQLDGKGISVFTDEFYCKGLGNVESTLKITYKNNRQKAFTRTEKLIEIK